MPTPRRALLASAASFALGGCLGVSGGDGGDRPTSTPRLDRDGDGVPDDVDDYPDDARRAYLTFGATGTLTLEPGEFDAIALTNSPRAAGSFLHYEASVAGDTPVDCLVLERDDYDDYADGVRDVPVVSRDSRTAVTETSLTAQLDRGEYLFVVDYTAQSTDPGAEPVEVNRVVELARRSGRRSARASRTSA